MTRMIHRIRKGIGLLLSVVTITTGLMAALTSTVYAEADEGGRVPYQFAFDNILSLHFSDTRIRVLRNLQLDLGAPLEAAGWVATPDGITGYQYLWLPVGEQQGEWQDVTTQTISGRSDLAGAGIPHASGHSTAGFKISIQPPADLAEGYYNVYVRAVDGSGVSCDLVALLNLRYGQPDLDDGKTHSISFPRIEREGAEALSGAVAIGEEGITLGPDGRVRLGSLDLAAFERLRITYTAEAQDMDGRRALLGLKSSGSYSYGEAGEAYNLTDNLLYTAIDTAGTLEIDLTEASYSGEVWLTGYLDRGVTVTGIEFIYNGYATDRVAAKIYLSEDLLGYFSGANVTEAKGITDPALGDVLRLEATQNTNDPYIHFNAGALLKENGILLDADEYKYMVILYRAETAINGDYMNLYLCSGNITGATEDCNQSVRLTRDGQWHYVLVDLSQKANWGGVINGWRFDYINADTDRGDGVEFATVQFFRTYEGATEAASCDISKQAPYHRGEPAVFSDMSEENGGQSDFVIPPEDSYVVNGEGTDTTIVPSDTPHGSEPRPTTKGCSATVAVAFLPVAVLLAACAVTMRKKD